MKHKLMPTFLILLATLCLCFSIAACGGKNGSEAEKGKDGHTHVAEQFQADESGHWKICTVCGEKFSVGGHSYNSDNACETCGYSAVFTKGLNYKLDEDTNAYTVTGPGEAKDVTDLIIPAYYEGKAVTSIREHAFEVCTSLTSITIPDSVTSIGYKAFYKTAYYNDAANWDSSGVLYIGKHLIEAKDTISGAYTVRAGTKTIAAWAFSGCSSLTSIEIPDSVTSIGELAFTGCSSLTSIEIPDSVTSIGSSAFEGCTSLTSVTIGNGVTSIGKYAFYECSGLTSIEIPDSVTSIGKYAFYKTAYYNDAANWDDSGVLYIGNHLIEAKADILSGAYTVRAGTKTIARDAFSSCSSLTSIEIPDSVTSIGSSAFSSCTSLTSIVIPDSVTSIGGSAFYNCTSLTSVTIGNGVTSIGVEAFRDCSGLESITIPDSVTSIGVEAFGGCSSLEHITVAKGNNVYRSEQDCLIETKSNTLISGCKNSVIPDGVTSIGEGAFYYCDKLTSITIPNSVTSIEEGAFWLCSGLTSVTIPDSVTSIGDAAFNYCRGLTSVTISDSVTSIGQWAFSGCDGLTDIYFDGTIEKWKEIKGPGLASMPDKMVVHCTNGDCDHWGSLIQS